MTVQSTNLFRDLGIGALSADFSNKSNVCRRNSDFCGELIRQLTLAQYIVTYFGATIVVKLIVLQITAVFHVS